MKYIFWISGMFLFNTGCSQISHERMFDSIGAFYLAVEWDEVDQEASFFSLYFEKENMLVLTEPDQDVLNQRHPYVFEEKEFIYYGKKYSIIPNSNYLVLQPKDSEMNRWYLFPEDRQKYSSLNDLLFLSKIEVITKFNQVSKKLSLDRLESLILEELDKYYKWESDLKIRNTHFDNIKESVIRETEQN